MKRLRIYFEPRDIWVGVYVAPKGGIRLPGAAAGVPVEQEAAVSDSTVLGLPLILAADDDTALSQPLAALVIVKAFDESGEVGVRHAVRSTDGLSTVEALGLARYAVLKLEQAIWDRGDDDE